MDPKRLALLRQNPELSTPADTSLLINLVEQSHMDGLSEAADILEAAAKRGAVLVDSATRTKRVVNAKILENASRNLRNYADALRKQFAQV